LKSEIRNKQCQTRRKNYKRAVWALTSRGANLAEKITAGLPGKHMLKSNLSACKIQPSACGHHWIFAMSLRNPGIELNQNTPSVFIDDILVDLPSQMLILRSGSLVDGIGCNRNTNKEEIKSFLHEVLNRFSFASVNLNRIAAIDIKKDKPSLIALAADLDLPITSFNTQDLNHVQAMETAVFIGSSASIEYLDFMITPRSYASKYSIDEQDRQIA